jgi:hypothetical protein
MDGDIGSQNGPHLDETLQSIPIVEEQVTTHLQKYSTKWAATYRHELVRFWPNAGEPSFKGEWRPDLKQF